MTTIEASAESIAREALDWAIDETCLKIPKPLTNPWSSAWAWDEDELTLTALTDDGEYRFNIGATLTAVLSVTSAWASMTCFLTWKDDDGKVEWEADAPAKVAS